MRPTTLHSGYSQSNLGSHWRWIFHCRTYKVSAPIETYYYTQIIGDARNPPTLLAAPNFVGIAVIGTHVIFLLHRPSQLMFSCAICDHLRTSTNQMLTHTFLAGEVHSGSSTKTTFSEVCATSWSIFDKCPLQHRLQDCTGKSLRQRHWWISESRWVPQLEITIKVRYFAQFFRIGFSGKSIFDSIANLMVHGHLILTFCRFIICPGPGPGRNIAC